MTHKKYHLLQSCRALRSRGSTSLHQIGDNMSAPKRGSICLQKLQNGEKILTYPSPQLLESSFLISNRLNSCKKCRQEEHQISFLFRGSRQRQQICAVCFRCCAQAAKNCISLSWYKKDMHSIKILGSQDRICAMGVRLNELSGSWSSFCEVQI